MIVIVHFGIIIKN